MTTTTATILDSSDGASFTAVAYATDLRSTHTGALVYAGARFLAGAQLEGRALVMLELDVPASEWSEARTTRTLVTVVDGKATGQYQAPRTAPAVAARKLAGDLETAADDVRLLPQLVNLVRNADHDELVPVTAPEPGSIAYAYAMGRTRRGLVTRVTKTKAEVAYTTASSGGRVFRKLVPLAELVTDAHVAAASAPVEAPAAVEPELAAGLGTLTAQLEAHVAAPAATPADQDQQDQLEAELADCARAGVHPGRIAEMREDSTSDERLAEARAAYAASAGPDPVTVARELGTTYGTLARLGDDDPALLPVLLPARTLVSAAWDQLHQSLAHSPARFDALNAWVDARTDAQYGGQLDSLQVLEAATR